MFPVGEKRTNDTMPSFSIKNYFYCQNINGRKVTKYAQLVYTDVSQCKVSKKQNTMRKLVQSQRKKTKRMEEPMCVIKKKLPWKD